MDPSKQTFPWLQSRSRYAPKGDVYDCNYRVPIVFPFCSYHGRSIYWQNDRRAFISEAQWYCWGASSLWFLSQSTSVHADSQELIMFVKREMKMWSWWHTPASLLYSNQPVCSSNLFMLHHFCLTFRKNIMNIILKVFTMFDTSLYRLWNQCSCKCTD